MEPHPCEQALQSLLTADLSDSQPEQLAALAEACRDPSVAAYRGRRRKSRGLTLLHLLAADASLPAAAVGQLIGHLSCSGSLHTNSRFSRWDAAAVWVEDQLVQGASALQQRCKQLTDLFLEWSAQGLSLTALEIAIEVRNKPVILALLRHFDSSQLDDGGEKHSWFIAVDKQLNADKRQLAVQALLDLVDCQWGHDSSLADLCGDPDVAQYAWPGGLTLLHIVVASRGLPADLAAFLVQQLCRGGAALGAELQQPELACNLLQALQQEQYGESRGLGAAAAISAAAVGATPLDLAIAQECRPVLTAMLQHGGRNAMDVGRQHAVQALQMLFDGRWRQPGGLMVLKTLCSQPGVAKCSAACGLTLLHLVTADTSLPADVAVSLAEHLCSRGADVDAVSQEAVLVSKLLWALQKPEHLQREHSSRMAAVLKQSGTAATPLQLGITARNRPVLEVLLRHGAGNWCYHPIYWTDGLGGPQPQPDTQPAVEALLALVDGTWRQPEGLEALLALCSRPDVATYCLLGGLTLLHVVTADTRMPAEVAASLVEQLCIGGADVDAYMADVSDCEELADNLLQALQHSGQEQGQVEPNGQLAAVYRSFKGSGRALWQAIDACNRPVVKVLLRYGVGSDAAGGRWRLATAALLAMVDGTWRQQGGLEALAAQCSKEDVARYAWPGGFTLLHFVAADTSLPADVAASVTKQLCGAGGADVDATVEDNELASHMLRSLLHQEQPQHAGQFRQVVPESDMTALQVAVAQLNPPAVQALLAAGANLAGQFRITPLAYLLSSNEAEDQRVEQIAQLLLDAGADCFASVRQRYSRQRLRFIHSDSILAFVCECKPRLCQLLLGSIQLEQLEQPEQAREVAHCALAAGLPDLAIAAMQRLNILAPVGGRAARNLLAQAAYSGQAEVVHFILDGQLGIQLVPEQAESALLYALKQRPADTAAIARQRALVASVLDRNVVAGRRSINAAIDLAFKAANIAGWGRHGISRIAADAAAMLGLLLRNADLAMPAGTMEDPVAVVRGAPCFLAHLAFLCMKFSSRNKADRVTREYLAVPEMLARELLAAGYQPATFAHAITEDQMGDWFSDAQEQDFCPFEVTLQALINHPDHHDQPFRLLRMLVPGANPGNHPPLTSWAPGIHPHFPANFKAAAKAFLLVCHHTSKPQAGPHSLPALPEACVMRVLELAGSELRPWMGADVAL